MSTLNSFQASHKDSGSFTIEDKENCTIVYGSMPIDFFSELVDKYRNREEVLIDHHLARMLNANFVFGTKVNLKKLKKIIEPEILEKTQQTYRNSGLSENAIRWLANGEQGLSSQSLFYGLTGISPMGLPMKSNKAFPCDSDDFRRCYLLLEQVPELKDVLNKAREISPEWSELYEQWSLLCDLYEQKKYPQLYKKIKEITKSN